VLSPTSGVIAIEVAPAAPFRSDQVHAHQSAGLFAVDRSTCPCGDIQAVKWMCAMDQSRRRLALRLQGAADLPLTRIRANPFPCELEQSGAELARFLKVPLEGV